MEKILVAPNAFKGHFTSAEVCSALEIALADQFDVELLPVSDGGDGFVDSIHLLIPELVRLTNTVTGPYPGMKVDADWLWDESNRIAYIESASACGLRLVQDRPLDPMSATSFGVGELIKSAIDIEAEDVYIGLGGTACSDGGVGAMQALGHLFLGEDHQPVPPGATGLSKISKIQLEKERWPRINLMVDVETRLLGDFGCAQTFATQKGATSDQVEEIERGMSNFWLHVFRDHKLNIDFPGAGAAGGIPAGLALMNRTSMGSGFDLISDLGDLDEKIGWADVVITGEGVFDSQSLLGKAPGSILDKANRLGKRTGIFAWKVNTSFKRTPEFIVEMNKTGDLRESAARLALLLREAKNR
jgi:glycerate 2-kinase